MMTQEPKMNPDHPATWADIFNTSHERWDINEAEQVAGSAGYKYMTWNGRVYQIICRPEKAEHIYHVDLSNPCGLLVSLDWRRIYGFELDEVVTEEILEERHLRERNAADEFDDQTKYGMHVALVQLHQAALEEIRIT